MVTCVTVHTNMIIVDTLVETYAAVLQTNMIIVDTLVDTYAAVLRLHDVKRFHWMEAHAARAVISLDGWRHVPQY